MTIVAILSKLIGGGLGAKLLGFNFHSAYIVGAGMVSRGEMALIIAQIGYQAKLLHPNLYSELIVVIVLSTILAPLLLKDGIERGGQVKECVRKRSDRVGKVLQA